MVIFDIFFLVLYPLTRLVTINLASKYNKINIEEICVPIDYSKRQGTNLLYYEYEQKELI